MALAAVNVTIGASLGGGVYNSVVKSRSLPLYDLTAVKADITAALGAAGGTHDSTTEITLVQTDVNALALAIDADVSVVINTANITNRNQLAHALRLIARAFEGSNLLTAG